MSDTINKPSVMIRASEVNAGRARHRRENPVTAAVATKLVRDTRTGQARGFSDRLQARTDTLFEASERISANMNDIENIFEVLPETERCEMIITSCILSPDDMKTVDLRHLLKQTSLPAALQASMLSVMEDFGTKTYKIKDKLPKILSKALFKTGSYPILCVPESSLDAMINHDNRISLESLSDLNAEIAPKGILGDNNRVTEALGKTRQNISLEDMLGNGRETGMTDPKIIGSISVSDNPNLIKLPVIQESITAQRVHDAYHATGTYGMESYGDGRRLNDIARRLYVRRRGRTEDVVRVRTQDQTNRNSVGHPMIVDLSSDAVIPVGNPSNMAEHFGYFILLDGFGNPLNNSQDSLYASQLEQRLSANKSESSAVLDDIKKSMYGACDDSDSDYARQMYGDFIDYIDRDLMERFDNGKMRGRAIQIARPNAVYQMMWARALSNKETKVVYVPRELLSYFAFDYNKRGIGKSLTDGTKILASLRALLLFATTRSAVRAAVGHKTLNLTLDPSISDPSKWVQQMVHEYIRVNNGNYPLGTSDPNDIMSYMEQAGISVNVENHPGYPEVKASVEATSTAISTVDPEIDRELRNRHISRYGLPPEVVDASTGVDFAATIRTSNVFLDKQLTQYKNKLCEQASDHMRMLAVNSGTIMSELFEAIEDNIEHIPEEQRVGDWKAELVIEFLENYYLDLPDSNNTKLETQLQKISTYSQVLDAVLASFATPEILTQMDPEANRDDCEAIVTLIKQHFLREFIISEGILPNVTDTLTWPGDEEEPAYNFMQGQTAFIEALGNTLRDLMARTKARRTEEAAKKNPEGENNQEGGEGGWGNM
ncbi:hypothetical protein pEaSNUABM54_00034 [Erwinia phage pEa_SNUABM_54]|nr:hypothetical protein pEaSNUABM54_00034 [Erwinia phage pEa_SNUABM_54]